MKAKRLVSMLLVILMIVGFTVTASAATETKGIIYNRIDGSSLIEVVGISDTLAESPSVSIPAYIDGKTIVSIANSAFINKTAIQTLELPKTLTSIYDSAFSNMSSLKSIDIPKDVQILGRNAFSYCKSLETVNFNTTKLTELSTYLFYGCSSLDRVIIPKSVISINSYTFGNCPNLKKIYIPSSVLSINEMAFAYSSNVVIYGDSGSTAENFAKKHNMRFEALNDKNTNDIDQLMINVWYRMTADADYYTTETLENVRTAYYSADEIRKDFFTTSSELENARQNLQDAYYSLELKNMSTLRELISQAENKIENIELYTENSINSLKKSLNSAKEISNQNTPTYEKVNSAINDLNTKIHSLVYQSRYDLEMLSNNVYDIIYNNDFKYTEETIDNLKNTYNSAIDFLSKADESTTNEEYINTLNELQKDYKSLKKLIIGDLNFDGKITSADAVMVQRNVLGLTEFNKRQSYTADFDENGSISIADIVMIQRSLINA